MRPDNLHSARLLLVLMVCGCSSKSGAEIWHPVDPSRLVIMSGTITPHGLMQFGTRSSGMRGQLAQTGPTALEVQFEYLGPGERDVALASGEMRRQIGIKLRSQDTCNVVYVMWHIEPSPGLEVSIKANPNQRQHSQCGDRGYQFLRPSSVRDVPAIERGSRHTLRAGISGNQLRVFADGVLSWVGKLPPEAFTFDGPPGIRSDNAAFALELRLAEVPVP